MFELTRHIYYLTTTSNCYILAYVHSNNSLLWLFHSLPFPKKTKLLPPFSCSQTTNFLSPFVSHSCAYLRPQLLSFAILPQNSGGAIPLPLTPRFPVPYTLLPARHASHYPKHFALFRCRLSAVNCKLNPYSQRLHKLDPNIMAPLSEALKLAWRLAAEETTRGGPGLIEPAHLLMGICRIGRVVDEHSWERYGVPMSAEASVRQEWTELHDAFEKAGEDPVVLRRGIRAGLPKNGGDASSPSRAARSQATRQIFERAEQASTSSAAAETTLPIVLREVLAVYEADGVQLDPALRVSLRRLHAALGQPASPAKAPVETPAGHVSLTISGLQSPFAALPKASPASVRDPLLYELPLRIAAAKDYCAMLATVLELALEMFPAAERGAVLVKERGSDRLLLHAHLPKGNPAVSLQLALQVLQDKTAVIWNSAAQTGGESFVGLRTAQAMYAPLAWKDDDIGVLCLDTTRSSTAFAQEDLRLFVAVAHHTALAIFAQRAAQDLKHKNLVLQRLLTQFSPQVRDRLVDRAATGRLALGGERSEVSILFADIRGFTRTSAGMEPDAVVAMLNDYFSAFVEAIFQHTGTVDKFIGDAVLAVFGSPERHPEHHAQAIRAALGMQASVERLNVVRKTKGLPICEIGVGVHSGEVLHGFVGSQERMEYTVIGDTVNKASRLCAAAGPHEVLISTEFHQHVWREVEVQPRQIETKHEGPMAVFHLVRMKGPAKS